jgi:hypothetical protein
MMPVLAKPAFAAAVVAFSLAACTETLPVASRAATSAPGVPIAVDSIAGAPDAMRGAFTSAFSNEASARSVQIVDPATNPRFRVRGYLNAEPTEDGQTALSFVWDVFDAQKRRAQRVQGAAVARSSSGDWSGVDQPTLSRAASESMDQIAQFLAVQGDAPAARTAGGAVARARQAAAR